MTRGPLAVVLALLLVAPLPGARADESTQPADAGCVLDTPAPKTSARLRWRSSPTDGEGAPGFWISDDAMERAAVRYDACNTGWSTCEVNLAVEKGKKLTPSWRAWAIGIGVAIVVGAAGGFYVGAVAK